MLAALSPLSPPPIPPVVVAPDRPGKSGQSIGHIAKQAVIEARAAGLDLPANAQGKAASAIARGADPQSVFEALVTPTIPPEGEAPPPDDTAPGADAPEDAPDAPLPDDPLTLVTGSDPAPLALDPAEVALSLLTETP